MKKGNIKVLIIGPFPYPISGVSLANKRVKQIIEDQPNYSTGYINTSSPNFDDRIGDFSMKKILNFFHIYLNLFKIFSSNLIYITPGQTFLGIIKYSPFILISSILKKELIIHVHGNHLGLEFKSLRGIKKYIFYFLISKFNKGIILSRSLKKNLTPFLKKEAIFILPNFIEERLFSKEEVVNDKELRIIYLSNLMIEKGVTYLLRSLMSLKNSNIKYKAKIAGNIDDKNKPDILNMINCLPDVEYLGVVEGYEKKEMLDWGNIFVLPTFYKMEGQPISILEAMATKNVIITTRHAGIPDIIKENINGFFVDIKSDVSITKRLIYLSENINIVTEIANVNKKYASSNFSLDLFKTRLLHIFEF